MSVSNLLGKSGAGAPKSPETRDDHTVCAIDKVIDTRRRPHNQIGTIRYLGIQIDKIELEVLYEGALFTLALVA